MTWPALAVRRLPMFALVLLSLVPVARADYLVVDRRVSVKRGPSAAAEPARRVQPGQILALAASDLTDNYFQVAFPPGQISWIYKGFVTRHAGEPPADSALPVGTLKVHILNIGQGDAILIVCPDGDHQLLIDTGDTRYPGATQSFKNALTELQAQDDVIEIAVASHPHSDHIGNMEWLLRQYTVGLYVDNGQTYDSATYRHVEKALTDRGVRRERVEASLPSIDFCPLEDVSAIILKPAGFGTLSDPNDRSVIVRVDHGEDSFLFVGDAELEEEEQLLHDAATRARLDCDFLKVGHHASDTSSGQAFLDAVTPDIAAFSAGLPGISTNAGYMHPRRSTIERLLKYVHTLPGPPRRLQTYDAKAKLWTSTEIAGALYGTPLDGELVFESTGNGILPPPVR